jgi:hypothetical protein
MLPNGLRFCCGLPAEAAVFLHQTYCAAAQALTPRQQQALVRQHGYLRAHGSKRYANHAHTVAKL